MYPTMKYRMAARNVNKRLKSFVGYWFILKFYIHCHMLALNNEEVVQKIRKLIHLSKHKKLVHVSSVI